MKHIIILSYNKSIRSWFINKCNKKIIASFLPDTFKLYDNAIYFSKDSAPDPNKIYILIDDTVPKDNFLSFVRELSTYNLYSFNSEDELVEIFDEIFNKAK